jgi:Zn-dependent protease with chaperone function/Zn ribbon nucleic-acid-binding protein
MIMKCPSCKDESLVQMYTEQGVEIDSCPKCRGIWLDKGEIYYFTRKPSELKKELDHAIKKWKPTERLCPRTGKNMDEISLLNGQVVLDYSPHSKGIWFDSGELEKLTKRLGDKFSLKIDRGSTKSAYKTSYKTLDKTIYKASPHSRHTALPALPNLFLRSASVLVFLYGLLSIVLITLTIYTDLTPAFALVIGCVIAAIQFVLGPFLTDLSLKWMYSMSWVAYDKLPGYLADFIRSTCDKNKMKSPRMGIIRDGSPNAFTYGHTPNNARIVLTQGLLDLLNEDEVKGVAAHEIGHAEHWDMLIMTAAQLIPLILYYIYRTLLRVRSSGRDKSATPRVAIAITSYILYIISEYLVLWLSRTREYYADRFAGAVTHNPNSLASALVKIGYGMVGRAPSKEGKDSKESREPSLSAVASLGIFDSKAGLAMAVLSPVSVSGAKRMGYDVDKDDLKKAMRWDMWNPWAKYCELNSTHPLIAERINHLSIQSEVMGLEPYIRFDEEKPESYWDEFFVDVIIRLLPILSFLGFLAAYVVTKNPSFIGIGIFVMGIALFLKVRFSYPSALFHEMAISGLLKKVKVSAVRPVPCKIKGTIIGRGVPGLIWSEDFVMQDETGIIFLDYSQPIPFWNFFFGLLKGAKYRNQEAEVTGWYRRMPVPYIELKQIKVGNERSHTCYTYIAKYFWAGVLTFIGLILAINM